MAAFPRVSLALYLAGHRLAGRSRAARRLRREIAAGRDDPVRGEERLGRAGAPRPPGALARLHFGSEAEAGALPDLVDRLLDARPDLSVLVTAARYRPDDAFAARLPDGATVQYAPYATRPAVADFLAHWRPDVLVWADNRLEPALLEAAARAGTGMLLIDARVPELAGRRWLPGMRRALLARFTHVLAGDERSAAGLARLGVATGRIETVGFLQEDAPPLTCSQAERDGIAEQLAARPVWLAAGAAADEVPHVIAAHERAMRSAHRLLLVLAPDPPEAGPALAGKLAGEGRRVGLRSEDDWPEPDTEIFVADLPDEFGLWYRLAPIAFMGGSLARGEVGTTRNPYEAAALGSVVLFGPHLGLWRENYERLREAGAARAVSDVASLARAVEYLIAPDKAAVMAAAAWEVTTSGAAASDRVVALVSDALDAKGV